jgi:four helix bundle protein
MTQAQDNPAKRYDLLERTALFGERTIDLLKKVPESALTRSLIDQLCRASASVGANYIEAEDALSSKDFRYRIRICRKEAKESKHFIRMIVRAHPPVADEARQLWQEAKELNLIFGSIHRKTLEQ